MNTLDFTFENAPWEDFLRRHQAGDRVSAARLLTLLEGEGEDALEDAFQEMETACMVLDLSDLPQGNFSGEAALRLKREADLIRRGLRPDMLEEGDPLRLYLEELASLPAWGEEDLLAPEAAAGKESAQLALTNLGLSRVVELAGECAGRGVLLLDLIQEGSLGLWKAVCTAVPGDYAAHRDKWIRFYMARAVITQARAQGAGQRMRTALEDYRQVDERLLTELGRNPTLEEIALEMHISAETAYTVKKMLDDARIQARQKLPEQEDTPEEADQPVENTALFQMRQRIADLLSDLSPEDSRLLTLRFGLEGALPLSPEETGRVMGLTPEEVTEREAAALARLRQG